LETSLAEQLIPNKLVEIKEEGIDMGFGSFTSEFHGFDSMALFLEKADNNPAIK